ncbi:SH3 domain-containing kinase-binding protein 1 [Scomber scombrus]|uniref:SH3 domain-containing kinase-binding protein 1 n=1 Tax=Scomber scombrus TaxID=13677 RepID=UPI002DDC8201|nr:SH3 domain-containing kinase-binding protein 1 [Scomber scombrus]
MGNYSSALTPDTEEFDSIVSMAERLNEQVTLTMEAESKENQSEELDSSAQQENSKETTANGPVLPAAEPKSALTQPSLPSAAQSFSSLLPKALAAVLQATRTPGHSSRPQHSRNPQNLQQLQTELRELRGDFEQMKSQHNKEIKLLMNELDEEKRIRLTLQMEIQRMKKHMSK